jgi:type I restriction enzyme, S subunit
MRKLRIGDVLIKSRDSMSIDDATEYRQVTVRMKHQGVCLRGYKLGKEIGTKQQSFVKKGQFILSKIDARNGAFGIIPEELEGAIITNDFLTYDVNEKELNIQLFSLLTSQPTFDDICNKASTGTTNRKRLSEREFLAQEITVPPIEEQDSFINHFKKIQALQENTKIELAIQADLIAKLRSSILSDAVSGRLVPQDPTDESASVLLERIKDEKERLIKEGELKRDKPLSQITEDEIPYELPEGWSWCRLGNVCINIHYGYTASAELSYDEPKMLRITDIQNNGVNWDTVPNCKITDKELEKYSLKSRDILIARTGGTVGKSFLMTNIPVKSVFASYLIRLIPSQFVDERYLKFALESPFYWQQLIAKSMGTGQPNVNGTSLSELIISVPSLKVQHKIVDQVEKLMTVCDALESEVAKSRMETDRLMQTILKEAFENKKTEVACE